MVFQDWNELEEFIFPVIAQAAFITANNVFISLNGHFITYSCYSSWPYSYL